MGNSCAGKRKHNSDKLSSKSNESFYYEVGKKDSFDDDKNKNFSKDSTCDLINHQIIAKESKGLVSENVLSGESTHVNFTNGIIPNEKITASNSLENLTLNTLTNFPDSIRKLLTGRNYLKNKPKKIVLFALTADPVGFSQENNILNTCIFPKLKAYANSQLFELFLINFNNIAVDRNARKLLDLNQWEFRRQIQSSFVIPVIFFSGLLNQEFQLPKILHSRESDTLLSQLSEVGCLSTFENIYEKQQNVYKLKDGLSEIEMRDFVKAIIETNDEIRETLLKLQFQEELQLILQKNYELNKKLVWITRFCSDTFPESNSMTCELKKRFSSLQSELKNHVVEKNILKIASLRNSNEKNEFINSSCKVLTAIIDTIIENYKSSNAIRSFHGLDTLLVEEINENVKFIQSLIKFSLPRDSIFDAIKQYLTGDSQEPLILTGNSGAGKSTIVAQIADFCQKNLTSSILINRFAQITKHLRIECVLHSILNQCSILLNSKPLVPINHTLETFSTLFHEKLEQFAQDNRSVIIIIDGINQFSLSTNENSFEKWLPLKLPSSKVKIIVTLKGNVDDTLYTNIVKVPEISEDKIAIWSSEGENLLKIEDQIIKLINDFEMKNGKDRTEIVFNYLIALGKIGITESEMFDFLLRENLFEDNWSYVQEFFLEFIQFFDLFLNWFQSNGYYLAVVKTDLHLSVIRSYYRNYTSLYQQIFNYFNDKIINELDCSNRWFKYKKIECLSFLAEQINRECYHNSNYVNDVESIFEKMSTISCCKVIEDFVRIDIEQKNEAQVNLQTFLEKYAFQLNYDSRQFYGYLNEFIAENPNLKWSEDILGLVKKPPVPTLSLVKNTNQSLNNLSGKFDKIVRINNNDYYIICICSSSNEICVWDILKGRPTRILKGVENATNATNIDQNRCIILSNRELKIFDLNEGKLLTKLKGVMNQKMPFYGLHDDKHVVALSRNRMYVNLMSIETGDCLTTFKAGEDRFLNSLLVSGNGQILVCGDETQKPFPLLVWNLKSRKLLYDLRIAHHDFVTTLAAITHDGGLMCCVCHEINEPNPNFIVVYDLQSGTLFKKWKPNYNTVSIEISSQSHCVITGLDNAEIMIWDLMTGNCRWTLSGHTAPVTCLRLDPHGIMFLSRNLSGHDLSFRIWSLKTGQLIAVYNPTFTIIDCEMTSRHVIILADNSDQLVTLEIAGSPLETTFNNNMTSPVYGLEENDGKVFEILD